MKIGITGGAGFIGGHVCEELVARGHKPVVFDRAGRCGVTGAEFFMGDVRDAVAVTELAAHTDAIIHLAAVLGTQETVGNPGPAAETNILGGINVLNACKEHRRPLVYAGVGNHWHNNTYSTTKTCVERLLCQYRDEFELRAATVRPTNAYGPRQAVAPPFGPAVVRKITPAFVCRALTNTAPEVYGDGERVSDMVWVKDVATVFCTTIEHLGAGKAVKYPIEVGPTKSRTVKQIAELVNEITGNSAGVSHAPMRPGEKPYADVPPALVAELYLHAQTVFSDADDLKRVRDALRTLDVNVYADTTTLGQVGLSADDFTPLEEGLVETVNWFKANEGVTWHAPR